MPAKASISLTANPEGLDTGLQQGLRMMSAFARQAASSMSALNLAPAQSQKSSWVKTAIGTAVGTFTRRGIDALVDQGKSILDFNDKLVRFGIASRKAGVELDYVGHVARDVGARTGLGAEEVLRGARAFVDMAGANAFTAEKMSLLARTAQASQTDIGQLAQVMYQLQKNMKVSDSSLEDTLGGVINMSKDGSVHFAQMAQEISELAPQAARYGMVGRQGVNQLTAMMQVARTGFGSVSEMGTGITRVFTGMTNHASKFAEYGVRIFNVGKDGTKTWRHFSDIFRDLRTNNVLSKDPELMRKVFGRSEADRTIRLWMENIELMKELEQQGKRNGVVAQDMATYAESAAGRSAIAFEKMKNAVAEAFTPQRIEAFTKAIEDLTSKVGPLAEGFGKVLDGMNWLYSIGKKMRGWVGDHGQMKEFFDPNEIMKEIDRTDHDHSEKGYERTYLRMINDRDATNKFIKEVGGLMPDDKTTPASNRAAVRAMIDSAPGSDLRNAADSYIGESGLTSQQVREIAKSIIDEQVTQGRGTQEGEQAFQNIYAGLSAFSNTLTDIVRYTSGRTDHVDLFTPSTRVDFVTALNRFTDAVSNQPIVLTADGDKIAHSVRETPKARRR